MRKLYLLFVLLSACQRDSTPVPEQAPPAPRVPPAEALAAYLAAWTAGDPAELMERYAPDAALNIVDSGVTYRGGEAIVSSLHKPLRGAFTDAKVESQLVLIDGQIVVAVLLLGGTSSGPFAGLPASNKPVQLLTAAHFDMNSDGTIGRETHFTDLLTAKAQLGAASAPHRTSYTPWTSPGATASTQGGPVESANIDAARAFEAAFNAHDFKALGELLAADVVDVDIGAPKDLSGKDAVQSHLREMFEASPTLRFSLHERWAAGEYVVSTQTLTEIRDGTWAGAGAGKKGAAPATIQMLQLLKLTEGKLTARWTFWNRASLAEQLASAPPVPTPPARKKRK